MKTALVTGANGQDGYYLTRQLCDEGWTVHGVVRELEHSSAVEDSRVVPHTCDLLDHSGIAQLVRDLEPHAVFNLGGLSSVAYSWVDPLGAAEVNGVAAVHLLNQCHLLQETVGREVRFIQASSAEIFGEATERPQSELTPVKPISPYGAAKAFSHHMVAAYRAKGLSAGSAILYNHESPRRPESFVTRKISKRVAEIAAGRASSLVLGSLDIERDWGWAPDYADAMVRMATAEQADDFVIATGKAHSLREFVQSAFAVVGIQDWQAYVSEDVEFIRPVDPTLLVGDHSKAREKLDWQPTCTFSELVERMVDSDVALLARNST